MRKTIITGSIILGSLLVASPAVADKPVKPGCKVTSTSTVYQTQDRAGHVVGPAPWLGTGRVTVTVQKCKGRTVTTYTLSTPSKGETR